MNYSKIYNQLVDRAKSENRVKGGDVYYEAHHIIPECLGGEGRVTDWRFHPNIVLLTAREHFLCHWLLHEIYPTNKKLATAFHIMCRVSNSYQNRYTPSSRIVEYAKLQMKAAKKNFKHSEESKRKISEAGRGRHQSKETTDKRVATRRKGDNYAHLKTEKSKKESSLRRKGFKASEETRKKITEANKKRWKMLSDSERKAIFKHRKGVSKPIIKCPHCDKTGGEGAMGRWHFDNCKNKSN